jgi:hypothetical protein
MSETPEKKKARLRYDNVFKTAWSDEFHFIKHSRKGNTVSDWFNDKELTNGSFRYKLRGKRLRKGPK